MLHRAARVLPLVLAVCLISAPLAPSPARAHPPDTGPPGDWALQTLTASDEGAVIWRGINATITPNGPEPVIVGIAVLHDIGSTTLNFSASFGGETTGISTSEDLGGVHHSITYTGHEERHILMGCGREDLAPGQTTGVLMFIANATATFGGCSRGVEEGSAERTDTYGTGSTAIPLTQGDGPGVDIAGTGAGAMTYSLQPQVGIVGGFLRCQCTHTWTAPDGQSRQWDSINNHSLTASFAGPPGAWTLEWMGSGSGEANLPTSANVAAYAPIGDAWEIFGDATRDPSF